ncbi:(R,S)-reticuline 7-O-methyltransferase-like [Camellia sinensis]|uniref:(R,S)-reticuline 7-O-methyltransferase-like n=1 Tax=Camellia sinensis TaxID=4442 RepID=UPI0010362D12|nr:(R,S)-reticuline 7-O-methyltransferase-like [Camellia sinensis]
MAHGRELWDFALVDSELNKVFNDGMECTARITIKALISEYKHGFDCIGSLVDVGGGTGASIVEIVKAYPHIKGTNFDLPHIVATAPPCPWVIHIGGDMFSNIPTTDAIFLKPSGNDLFDNIGMAMDLVMLMLLGAGEERIEFE